MHERNVKVSRREGVLLCMAAVLSTLLATLLLAGGGAPSVPEVPQEGSAALSRHSHSSQLHDVATGARRLTTQADDLPPATPVVTGTQSTPGSSSTGARPQPRAHHPPRARPAAVGPYDALIADVLAGGAPSRRATAAGHGPEPSLLLRAVVEVEDPTTSEFVRTYGTQYGLQPVKITASQIDWLDPQEWDLAALREVIGGNSVYYDKKACHPGSKFLETKSCHHIKEADPRLIGKKWAGLKATNLTELGIKTFNDVFDAQIELAKTGRYLYAHEISGHALPQLEERMFQPKYFRNSFGKVESGSQVDAMQMMHNAHFPSFFFGPAGSSSPLHTDAGMTRFWLLQLAGKKLVRMIAPPDNWRGDPSDGEDYAPTLFTVDLLNPDYEKHPNMAGLVVWETVLEPGDILFIPEGWAHQALNLEWSAMISANYIDQFNAASVLKMHSFTKQREPLEREEVDLQAYYLPLLDMEDNLSNVQLSTFFREHILEDAAVSHAAMNHVARLNALGVSPSDWRDRFSRPVLNVALKSNYVRLAKFLVSKGVPLENDERGRTLLKSVEEQGLQKMAKWMRRHMGVAEGDDLAATESADL